MRTIYLCRHVADEELRRQLNKGESLHALRRDLPRCRSLELSTFPAVENVALAPS